MDSARPVTFQHLLQRGFTAASTFFPYDCHILYTSHIHPYLHNFSRFSSEVLLFSVTKPSQRGVILSVLKEIRPPLKNNDSSWTISYPPIRKWSSPFLSNCLPKSIQDTPAPKFAKRSNGMLTEFVQLTFSPKSFFKY